MSAATASDYEYLRQLVFEQSENVLDPARDYLFETRLARLLRNNGMSGLDELVRTLRKSTNPALARSVAEAMTINETSFFRDSRPFELLRTELLPELIEKRRTARSIRFWSAACSSGQEGYSMAMLMKEHFPLLTGWNIRIEGTDISAEMVHRASTGTYHRIEINRGLPAKFVVRYFDHVGEDWTAKPEIKQMCNFRQANLCAPLPFKDTFDVIFLRNVMLYFSMETRRKLLQNVHRLLAPDGFLFLGSSEQPVQPELWNTVIAGGTCYYRPRSAN